MMLRNFYGVDLGTSGLILQAQSREEILADKVIALAFRPNRIKNRDLWDIAWLKQQGIELPLVLVPAKINDHRHTVAEFRSQLKVRLSALNADPAVRREYLLKQLGIAGNSAGGRRMNPIQRPPTYRSPALGRVLPALRAGDLYVGGR